MVDLASLHAFISGKVQGTYFRAFTKKHATELGLTGYVQNLPGGTVEVVAEGDRKALEKLIAHLNVGPPAAHVSEVLPKWGQPTGAYDKFEIRY